MFPESGDWYFGRLKNPVKTLKKPYTCIYQYTRKILPRVLVPITLAKIDFQGIYGFAQSKVFISFQAYSKVNL